MKTSPEIDAAIELLRKAGYEIEAPVRAERVEEVVVKLKPIRDPSLTPAQVEACFRMTGFQPSAEAFPHTEEAYVWLCRFNGAEPGKTPWTWRYASSAGMRDYINRMAAEDAASGQDPASRR